MSSFIYLGTSFEVHVICFMSRTHHLFKTGFKNMGSIKRSKTVVRSMTESYPSLTKRVRQLPALQTTRARTHARRTQIYVIILPWINIILNPKYTPWCERTPWRCSEKNSMALAVCGYEKKFAPMLCAMIRILQSSLVEHSTYIIYTEMRHMIRYDK